MGICFGCFGGGDKRMTKEEERLASEEARARAAEAAQKRFIPFSFVLNILPNLIVRFLQKFFFFFIRILGFHFNTHMGFYILYDHTGLD